jgi:hypothetical protein
MSLSNYQYNRFHGKTIIYILLPIKINPKISKKAIRYLKKNKIPVEEFLYFIRLITVNEGALIRTYSGTNVTEHAGIYVDLFEWDDIKSISIQVDFPNKTVDEIVDSIFKLNGLLYKAYPNLDAHFIYQPNVKTR